MKKVVDNSVGKRREVEECREWGCTLGDAARLMAISSSHADG